SPVPIRHRLADDFQELPWSVATAVQPYDVEKGPGEQLPQRMLPSHSRKPASRRGSEHRTAEQRKPIDNVSKAKGLAVKPVSRGRSCSWSRCLELQRCDE